MGPIIRALLATATYRGKIFGTMELMTAKLFYTPSYRCIFLYYKERSILIAISQNTANDSLGVHRRRNHQMTKNQEQEPTQEEPKSIHQSLNKRAIRTLDAIRSRAWKDK
jgi:hypothetical protein